VNTSANFGVGQPSKIGFRRSKSAATSLDDFAEVPEGPLGESADDPVPIKIATIKLAAHIPKTIAGALGNNCLTTTLLACVFWFHPPSWLALVSQIQYSEGSLPAAAGTPSAPFRPNSCLLTFDGK
jgi:hypothetical protein